MFGFFRCAACVPMVRVADTEYNLEHSLALAESAGKAGCAAALFPELGITGYSCGDLFHNSQLLSKAENAVRRFAKKTAEFETLFVIGAPVRKMDRLFDAAVLIQKGKICGIVPKINLQNRGESYEKRCFSSGAGTFGMEIAFAGQTVPFGQGLVFPSPNGVKVGIEIGADMESMLSPGCGLVLAGANLLLNPAASSEIVGKAAYRKSLVSGQSGRCVCAYLYASAGVHESTADSVCGGHCLAAVNGKICLDSPRFERADQIHFTDFDLEQIAAVRLSDSSFANAAESFDHRDFRQIEINAVPESDGALAELERTPFVPQSESERNERCAEIFAIQSAALAKRVEHSHAKKLVLGISGGLDSTLALLVCVNTVKLLNRPMTDILAVTMPGFGTTDRTYDNAVGLCRKCGVELREINIGKACLQHFADIGHDPENRNVVYENTQARERTQILHDLANAENGLCVGTGDLSESAMGWCTYNGDHISMYGVNCSVPKTLIRSLIMWIGGHSEESIRAILQDIIDTPVSPELLPAAKNGEIRQKTEEIIGPYEIHDFFLYHFVKYGTTPEKLLFLAKRAFGADYPEEKLKSFLTLFLRRFFTQQFKRSCCPDGPKVGTIALSPRGDWRMPSDASAADWIN